MFTSADLMSMDRRQFLWAAAGLPLAACVRTGSVPGEIVGPDFKLGHRMRDGHFPAPSEEKRARVVIVGGGISGLAAARQLARRGIRDFVLLELDREPGGNASSGRNAVSGYPWGAHYVPLPGEQATEVLDLFRELGIIMGQDGGGRPVYREEYLCHDPMDRLFINGGWQEGLVPQIGVPAMESREIEAFLAEMTRLRNARGSDGRPAFAIPLDRSSSDAAYTGWDGLSMSQWLDQHDYKAPALRWYVDYCCRDDFGAPASRVSAWAGLHYFAARRGEAANGPAYVVTWPEGNGWLVNRLREPIADHVQCRQAVWAVQEQGADVLVDAFDAERETSCRWRAEQMIFAAPRFAARHVVRGLGTAGSPSYAPWMVANLTLSEAPFGAAAALSWDNVFYNSQSLGYVVATHQHLDPYPRETVLTYYQPLDHTDPAAARQEALRRSHASWCEQILADLEIAHPEIRELVRRIDIKVWGHGMVVPSPGFIWGSARQAMAQSFGRIRFAHSDMSGLSLFEEAYTRGVAAANEVAESLG